jgi:hypothetical protein
VSEEVKELAEVKNNVNNQGSDMSKVKIRHILKQRLKSPKFKKAIPFLIVGIICFSLGIGLGSLIGSHNKGRADSSRVYSMDKRFDGNQRDGQLKGMPRGSRK